MSICEKTGVNVYVEDYGGMIRTDLIRIGKCYLLKFGEMDYDCPPSKVGDYQCEVGNEGYYNDSKGGELSYIIIPWNQLTKIVELDI